MAGVKHEYQDVTARPATNRAQDELEYVHFTFNSCTKSLTEGLQPPTSSICIPIFRRIRAAPTSVYSNSLHAVSPRRRSQEKSDVPMIHSVQKHGIGDYLPWGSAGKVERRTVIVRQMTRDCCVKHYAKDDAGNYVGTEKMYPDAGLVLVPSKSTGDDVLQQVSS